MKANRILEEIGDITPEMYKILLKRTKSTPKNYYIIQTENKSWIDKFITNLNKNPIV